MTLNEVIRRICAGEGKKIEVPIYNVREVLRVLREVCKTDDAWYCVSEYLRYSPKSKPLKWVRTGTGKDRVSTAIVPMVFREVLKPKKRIKKRRIKRGKK
jgi:hypothetical protein